MSGAAYQVVVEPEVLPARRLVSIVIVGALVILASATIVLWVLPSRAPVETGGIAGAPQQIGALQGTLLADVHTTQDRQQRERAALRRYQWVDRSRGIVAIPIDRAMDLLVEQNP